MEMVRGHAPFEPEYKPTSFKDVPDLESSFQAIAMMGDRLRDLRSQIQVLSSSVELDEVTAANSERSIRVLGSSVLLTERISGAMQSRQPEL